MASIEPTSATITQEAQQRIFEHRRIADRLAHQKKSESQRSYKAFDNKYNQELAYFNNLAKVLVLYIKYCEPFCVIITGRVCIVASIKD